MELVSSIGHCETPIRNGTHNIANRHLPSRLSSCSLWGEGNQKPYGQAIITPLLNLCVEPLLCSVPKRSHVATSGYQLPDILRVVSWVGTTTVVPFAYLHELTVAQPFDMPIKECHVVTFVMGELRWTVKL